MNDQNNVPTVNVPFATNGHVPHPIYATSYSPTSQPLNGVQNMTGLKYVLLFVAFVIAIAAGVFCLVRGSASGAPSTADSSKKADAVVVVGSQPSGSTQNRMLNIGWDGTTSAPVASVPTMPPATTTVQLTVMSGRLTTGSTPRLLLNSHKDYKDPACVTIVLEGPAVAGRTTSQFLGKTIKATGVPGDYQGRKQVVVTDPMALSAVPQ